MNLHLVLLASLLVFLSSLTGGAWESVEFREGVEQAQRENKDILLVYTSARMGKAGKCWRESLLTDPSVKRGLEKQFILSHIVLPSKVSGSSVEDIRAVRMASIHGVTLLPTMILCDKNGRAYARVLGGVKTPADSVDLVRRLNDEAGKKSDRDKAFDAAGKCSGKEKEKYLLKGLEFVPVSAWGADYPEVMRQFEALGSRAVDYRKAVEAEEKRKLDERVASLILRASVCSNLADADRFLKEFDDILSNPGLGVEVKQLILLNGRYPLLVKKARLHYDGKVTMESEEAFDESVETLEKARDMDKSSYWGREAHRIREELRRARLSAARFD